METELQIYPTKYILWSLMNTHKTALQQTRRGDGEDRPPEPRRQGNCRATGCHRRHDGGEPGRQHDDPQGPDSIENILA